MERALKKAGFHVINRSYSWYSQTLAQICKQLDRELSPFQERDLYFVTHSFGGIVLRAYLHKHRPANAKRAVMLAPPNQGSCIASFLRKHPLAKKAFLMVYGKSMMRLTPQKAQRYPPPYCEFAVIAGGRGKVKGYTPFLPEDNDGVVCVSETKLAGMRDFALLPHKHTFIMNGLDTLKMTLNFFQTGEFHPEKNRSRARAKKSS